MSEPARDPEAMRSFLRRVALAAEWWCHEWGLHVLPPLHTDALDPDDTLAAALALLRDHATLTTRS